MKISRKQLRSIIREAINEAHPDAIEMDYDPYDDLPHGSEHYEDSGETRYQTFADKGDTVESLKKEFKVNAQFVKAEKLDNFSDGAARVVITWRVK